MEDKKKSLFVRHVLDVRIYMLV